MAGCATEMWNSFCQWSDISVACHTLTGLKIEVCLQPYYILCPYPVPFEGPLLCATASSAGPDSVRSGTFRGGSSTSGKGILLSVLPDVQGRGETYPQFLWSQQIKYMRFLMVILATVFPTGNHNDGFVLGLQDSCFHVAIFPRPQKVPDISCRWSTLSVHCSHLWPVIIPVRLYQMHDNCNSLFQKEGNPCLSVSEWLASERHFWETSTQSCPVHTGSPRLIGVDFDSSSEIEFCGAY